MDELFIAHKTQLQFDTVKACENWYQRPTVGTKMVPNESICMTRFLINLCDERKDLYNPETDQA